MNPLSGSGRKHREPLELQLTAMIDIFSMILIFLIMGSVFGGVDIVVPNGVKLPRSKSSELSSSALTVAITSDQVQVTGLENKNIPLNEFRRDRVHSSGSVNALRGELKKAIDKMSKEEKDKGVPLNVVCDEKAPYRDVFDVMQVFRGSGFNTILFVATSER